MKSKISKFQAINTSILFLFILTTINRELKPLGIDLRYILLLLVFVGLMFNFKNLKDIRINKFQKMVSAFYLLFVIFTVLRMPMIDFMDRSSQISLFILHMTNFIVFMYITLFIDVRYDQVVNMVSISIIILILSFVVSYVAKDYHLIFSNIDGIISSKGMRNFYGLNFRAVGYAQDPNYASFSLMISLCLILLSKYKNRLKLLLGGVILVSYGFTASTTIILGTIAAIIIVFIANRIIGQEDKVNVNRILLRKFLFSLFVILVVLFPFIIYVTKLDSVLFQGMSTVWQRFAMWRHTIDLFFKSPIIGSGIGAARSFYGLSSRVVQVHNSGLQIFSEGGLIVGLIYVMMMIKVTSSFDKKVSLIGILFVIFGMSYEIIQLQFFPFILIIYYFFEYKKNLEKEYDLVFVNSLSGGGAETLAHNLIREVSKSKPVIVFANEETITTNNATLVKMSSKNIFKNIFSINAVIECIGINQVSLSTTHLFKSHFFTSLSVISMESIYVMHGTVRSYSKNIIQKTIYKIVYFRKKITFMNEEIENDFINQLGIKSRQSLIIRNFLNSDIIKSKSEEEVEENLSEYIIYVGRLEHIKDPHLALEVFNELSKKEKYNLLFLGSGSLETSLKTRVDELNLNDRVTFYGFVSNPYKYMKQAKLLLLTSEFESDSLVILESLLLDTPVVSADCDYGPRYILKNEFSEFLIQSRTPEDFVDSIQKVKDSYPIITSEIFKNRSFDYYYSSLKEFYNE